MKIVNVDVFEVRIEKNKRARHLKLRFDKKGNPVVSIPWWVTYRAGEKFAQDNVDWLRQYQSKQPSVKRFEDQMEIQLLGQHLKIVHQPIAKRGVWIEGDFLYVSGPIEHLHRRVRDFIKKQAYAQIQEKSVAMAAQIQRRPTGITLRDTSSRWGSCSTTGHLNFCWKLALAPDFVLEYIIAHEVSHLAEMNHGPAFWKTVGCLTNHRADAHIWLKKNGPFLQSWE